MSKHAPTEKERVDRVREAVDELNEAVKSAALGGIVVELVTMCHWAVEGTAGKTSKLYRADVTKEL